MKSLIFAHTESITGNGFAERLFPDMDGEKIKEQFFAVFSDMADFAVRELDFGKAKLYIAYFVGFSAREYMNEYMIEPISRAYASEEATVPLSSLITNIKIEKLQDFKSQ